jgi:dihydrofolate reductase
MSNTFINIGLSLDGCMAPAGMTLENWEHPDVDEWGAKWQALMGWIFTLEYFQQRLSLGSGGETGPLNDMLRHTFERTGAYIMGKRMFEAGEIAWPEEAPFHAPVFVLTHEQREPWIRPGGTTFYFTNEDPVHVLERAHEAANGKDVRISGGANVIQQYLNLGVIDEIEVALAPVLFGSGRRLFEHVQVPHSSFHIDRVMDSPLATHIKYVRT